MTRTFYNEGSREIQDRFDSRRIADRLEQVTLRRAFTEEDKAFISKVPMFFLATADADGHPDCSYKGGLSGSSTTLRSRFRATTGTASSVVLATSR